MKKLVCLFSSYGKDTCFRDMFLVPYYIGKLKGYSTSFVYHGKLDQKKEMYRKVELLPLKYRGGFDCFSFKSEWYFFWYIFKYARKIDFLIRFHFSYQTFIIGLIYKLRNPNGFFYIKGDGYGIWLSLFKTTPWFDSDKPRNQDNFIVKFKNKIIHSILEKTIKISDLVSVELPEIYNRLKEDRIFYRFPSKLKLMFNGLDEERIKSFNIKEYTLDEKENLIISVGRHGSWQKDTKTFLDSLCQINLKNWTVLFIGKVEESFRKEIDDFFQNNPQLEGKVIFKGPIYNQKELYEIYNRSKVFVHTALYESYGIVIGEAFRFNNYIVSTPVGISPYLTKYGYGELYEKRDSHALKEILQSIIDEKVDLKDKYEKMEISTNSISIENEIAKLNIFD